MKNIFIISIVTIFLLTSCSIYNTITNISKLKFKIDSVSDFKVVNIDVSGKSKLKDFKPLEILTLTSEFASGKLPVTFNLNVEVKNPNQPVAGSTVDIVLKDFPWTLYLDGNKTISGNIGAPVKVPGGIKTEILPFQIKLDLMEFFTANNLDSILNLVLKFSGSKSAASTVKLVASPLIGTPIGDMQYPEPITIINQKFN